VGRAIIVKRTEELLNDGCACGRIILLDRSAYERVEGIFHDGLGTYFELLVANQLIDAYALPQPEFDLSVANEKISAALLALSQDTRQAVLAREAQMILAAASACVSRLRSILAGQTLLRVDHTAAQYVGGAAADLVLHTAEGEVVPVSLKTDKSSKSALADMGQTSNLYKWFAELFSLSQTELEQRSMEATGLTLAEAKLDFQNIAHLVQAVLIESLGLEEARINDLGRARPSNEEATRHLFRRVKFFKGSHDRAIVLVADRRTGAVSGDALIDEVDPESLDIAAVGFTPSSPAPHYRYGSTIGVKYLGRTLFDFQIKHQRGPGLSPERRRTFRDITTRLRISRLRL
jgi:hypothetical protein